MSIVANIVVAQHKIHLDIKGRSILFNHFIDIRTTIICSFHVEKTCFCWKINGCSHVYKVIE